LNNEKSKTFTAFLSVLLILALLSPLFVNAVDACWRRKPHKPRPPPLGKTIIKYFVYPDGTPIGGCLEVELWDTGTKPIAISHTDSEGKVVFSGLVDQTYTVKYQWQGVPISEPLGRINCSKIVWEFTNEVPYWTVEKTFLYDVSMDPIEGLNVTFDGRWALTDASGTVSFDKVKAGDYTLEWMWGGVTKTEAVSISFQDPSPYVVPTNYLESKSGGGK